MQLLNIRQIPSAAGPPRYRLMMSDGQHSWSSFLLATQLNHLPEDNLLVPNCVCKVKKTVTNTLSDGRTVVIVMDMDVLQSADEIGGKIGNPTPYDKDGMVVLNCVHRVKKHSSPDSSTKVISIAQLNPYQSKWTIRARVTNKSSIRNWSNSKGEGKLFSFEILDESGEIRITAFNKEVDKFYTLVEQGKVYYITKGTLKAANKQYTTVKNDYEMTLHAHSSIVPCDDGQGIPAVHCDFVPIAELENRDKDAIIDVIGVCKSADDVSRITTKTSREVSKRALNLIDTTGKEVAVTLWGEEAEKFDASGQPVVAVKGARLSDFGGRSLSALFSSTVMVNPDIPEAFRLRAWFDREGYAANSQSLTETRSMGSGARMNWKALSDIKDEEMGHGEKAEYFSCVATVVYTRKENCLYPACPSADCNKKVIDQNNGLYRCEKCNREYPNFKYRLLLSANLADFGDNQWVTFFQETAEVLLGQSAETLGELRETGQFHNLTGKWEPATVNRRKLC
uniref:Replication protein A subunit n=1 Tax=Sparus aurata TaxID=8175 RepID=A0A671U190_SPAAU